MAASLEGSNNGSNQQRALRLDATLNHGTIGLLEERKTTSGKSRSDETLDELHGTFHLPALRIRKPDGPIKKGHYTRSTSADQESPENDHFHLAPIVTSLRRGYSSEDISKSVSDSALHVSVSSISSPSLDPFRHRSSSTSMTQSKYCTLVTPKISIDEYPDISKIKKEAVNFSGGSPITDLGGRGEVGGGAHNTGNLTPPVDRSKKFPRSIRTPSTCECQGLHEKGCPLRSLSRSMDNIHGTSRTELSVDPRLSRLRHNLFPSYPFSAPSSPKNVHKSLANHRHNSSREKTLTSPMTVFKSQLLPRTRSQSAKNLRQIQVMSPSPPRRKLNGRQTLPKLKLSDAEDGLTSRTSDEPDDRFFHPRDQNLLSPGRLEIRSPPLTDYSSDW